MPVGLAPRVRCSERAGKAALGRDLAYDAPALPRPSPYMGEAEKVERRVRNVRTQALWPEVHIPRLGLMQRQPVAAKAFAKNIEHAPAAFGVLKEHHKVIGEPHQLTHASQSGLRLPLKPLVRYRVQEDIREHRADYPALRRAGFGSLQDPIFENPRFQPFVDQASDHAIFDPQVEDAPTVGVRDAAEVIRQVSIDHPPQVSLHDARAQCVQGIVG